MQYRWRPIRLSDLGTEISTDEEVVQPSSVLVLTGSDILTRCMADMPECVTTFQDKVEGGLLSSPEQV